MGELRQLNEQNKLAIWAERVTECRNSGQSVRHGAKSMVSVVKHITSGKNGCLVWARQQ